MDDDRGSARGSEGRNSEYDAASQGSKGSAAARKAALMAEAEMLKELEAIEMQELQCRYRRREIGLKMQLAKAEAKIDQPDGGEDGSIGDDRDDADHEVRDDTDQEVILNPRAPEWHPAAPTMPVPIVDSTADRQQQFFEALQLPRLDVMTFNGDPLKYWSFIRSFENTVEKFCIGEEARLMRLIQCTTGRARQMIQCCCVMKAEKGYKRAKELLKERFGNDYVITETWIKRITSFGNIKPAEIEKLREYADEVNCCKETLKAMGRLNEINNQTNLLRIVEKLPVYLQHSWRKEVREIRIRGKDVPNIEHLTAFIERAAEAANDPVFGLSSGLGSTTGDRRGDGKERPHGGQNASSQGNKRQSFSGVTSSDNVPSRPTNMPQGQGGIQRACIDCGGTHSLFQCEHFRGLKPEERRKLARSKGLCFNCLRVGHKAETCQLQRTCSVPGCGRRHTHYLHLTTPADEAVASTPTSSTTTSSDTGPAHSVSANQEVQHTFSGASARVALPLVPVKVWAADKDKCICTYALLDNGSTTTFCTKRLAEQLQKGSRPEVLTLNTSGQSAHRLETSVVKLDVTDVQDQNAIHLSTVYTTEELPISPQCKAIKDELNSWSHLRDIEVCVASVESVDLLIGQDNPEALIPKEVRVNKDFSNKAPFAVRTLLGWTVQGPIKGFHSQGAVVGFTRSDTVLQENLKRFWEMDSNEVDDVKGTSVNDRRVLQRWENEVQVNNGHYELPVPFNEKLQRLSNNRIVAEQRLKLLQRKLTADPQKCSSYKQGIADMISKGYVEKVPEDERNAQSEDSVIWYLPHHSVTSAQKPDKIRIVFDCAAKYDGVSLNDVVLQGPDLTNRLTGVLMRFRLEPIALMADIESMFYQVQVTPRDRDVLRFLWWKNHDVNAELEEYRMKVYPFGGIWSPSCANFALRRTAEDNNQFDEEVRSCIYRNFYVDDCLKSVNSQERAVMFVRQLTELLACGGFHLTKWISNCRDVLRTIPEEDRAQGVKNLDISRDRLPTERALGAVWDVESDTLGFRSVINRKSLTRRGILSILCSVYDPLGFLSPFVLPAKCLLQDLCRQKVGWDDDLSAANEQTWKRWLCDLDSLHKLQVSRCLKPPGLSVVITAELHHFSDASKLGYGAVCYLRLVDRDGLIHCAYLMSKSRVAPIRSVTIPRLELELCAAVLSAQLDGFIRRELDIVVSRSIYWTDSTAVLHYILNEDKRFHTFVANRIAAIHSASSPSQWRYVNTALNPADDVSRGLTAEAMMNSHRWFNGPYFLWQDESFWPDEQLPSMSNIGDLEIKSTPATCVAQTDCQEVFDRIFQRRSSWFELKRDIAHLLRVKQYLSDKASGRQISVDMKMKLSVAELVEAELQIIKYVQKQAFPDEVRMLQRHNNVAKTSAIYRLEPIIDENGVIRIGGRLRSHPAILPKHHAVTHLIVRYFHVSLCHCGREHTLSKVRQQYWIVRARSVVRSVLKQCAMCRLNNAKPAGQRMSDLPADRTTPGGPPFSCVGVDLFGPFNVKRGRSIVKRYGCIFTCLKIRAVHIEVVHSLDTDSFINALQRFVCRRGSVTEIRSDNGSNFVGAEKELRTAMNQWNATKIDNFLRQKQIQWRFNPPAASHMGGVWERQIRSVRRILNVLMKDQSVDDESLNTLFCLVESIINSRPLTTVSDDHKDPEPLTPNHLLLLQHAPPPPGEFSSIDVYCKRRWRQVQYLSDVFWRRWTREYISTLHFRQKWYSTKKNLEVGDIVIIVDDNVPRNAWQLGRLTETYPGPDGLIRSAKVTTKTGMLTRPVHKLCLLESVQ